jgi:polysaccharide biosynthesis transport protein
MESTSLPSLQQSLQNYLAIAKRHWVPASSIFIVVTAIGLLSASQKKPIYSAEGSLRFERVSSLSSLTGVGKEASSLEPLEEKNSPISTESAVIRSFPLLQTTISKLDLRDDHTGLPLDPKNFLKHLNVVGIKQTDILTVSYKDADPRKATEIVNTLISTYLDNNLLAHRTRAMAARKFIEEQLPKTEATVKEAETALRRFKSNNDIIALKEEATALVQTTKELQQEISTAQSQLGDTEAQAAVIKSQLGLSAKQAMSSVVLSQSVGVQEVLKQIQQLEAELAIERTRFQPTYPKILVMQEKLTQLQKILSQRIAQTSGNQLFPELQKHLQMGAVESDLTRQAVNLEAKRQGLRNQINTLRKVQENYNQRNQLMPQLEAEQRELERKLEASQTTYLQLLQKVGEIGIAEKQNVGNARVISFAQVPHMPISPNHFSYILPVLLGLISAGAAIYGLEAFDKSVKNAEQAKQLLGFPILSVIPYADKPAKLLPEGASLEYCPAGIPLIRDRSYSSLNAAYRVLHANVKFLRVDFPPREIVIASSVPQEGKSTVTANLALAIAQSNQRVLLIDADLYRPLQHQIWDAKKQIGLSDVLLYKAEVAHAIEEISPNLHLLSAGTISNDDNSLALIDSARMAALIERLSANYDFVLIDTPPLTMTTEALILGKMTDGILFVIRPGLVDQDSAKYAKELLGQSNQTVLGLVVNDIATKSKRSYYLTQYQSSLSG